MLNDDLRELRARLFVVAYKMTRHVFKSEDVVQDVLLEFAERKPGNVRDVQKYLAKAVIYKSLDLVRSEQKSTYVGVDLPEPVTDPVRVADLRHDVSFGTLLLLRQLNPLERAVFVLHESFDYSYAELSEILGRTEDHCRQLMHRAREKMQMPASGRPDSSAIERFQRLFLRASMFGEMEAFVSHLRDDIRIFADGGGKAKAALHPIVGRTLAMTYLSNLYKKFGELLLYQPAICNGQPAVVMINKSNGQIDTLAVLEVVADQITCIYLLRNPDKLKAIRLF